MYSLYYVRKTYVFTMHNIIALWFSLVAFLGYLSVLTGIYQNVHGEIDDLPSEPYLLAFVAYIILMWPFRTLNTSKLYIVGFPSANNKKLKIIMTYFLLLFSIILFIRMYAALFVMQLDGSKAYEIAQTKGTIYDYSTIELKLVTYIGMLYEIVNPILLFCSISQFLNKSKYKQPIYMVCLIMTVLITLFYNISQGARGGLFITTIDLLILILPFWKFMNYKVKASIKRGMFVFGILFFVYSAIMTISRFDDKETPIESFIRYLGEPFPHLGNKIWDQVQIHPLGSRFFPFIFGQHFQGANQIASNAENQQFWGDITGVPILNYKTIYGDFYIEFGTIIALLFIILYSILFRAFIKKGEISIAMVPILYYYIDMYSSAPLLFGKWGLYNVRQLFFCIIAYFFIKKFISNKNKYYILYNEK